MTKLGFSRWVAYTGGHQKDDQTAQKLIRIPLGPIFSTAHPNTYFIPVTNNLY